jgi:hypothetical protein
MHVIYTAYGFWLANDPRFENNPIREGLRAQKWKLVIPYRR